MRRRHFIVTALIFAAALGATTAFASARFLEATATATDGNLRTIDAGSGPIHGGLYVTFREVGLGKAESILYEVFADASATYACINNGENHPQAQNKETVAGPISTNSALISGDNGQLRGAIAVPPLPPGNLACPPGQFEVLWEVSYTNVRIHDATNDVWASIPGTFSLSFAP